MEMTLKLLLVISNLDPVSIGLLSLFDIAKIVFLITDLRSFEYILKDSPSSIFLISGYPSLER